MLFSGNCYAQEMSPMAPKRYDNRDELPVAAFVSLTGADPVPLGEKPSPTAVAKVPNRKNMKLYGSSKVKNTQRKPANTKKASLKLPPKKTR